MKIISSGRTDIGLRRKNNEDACLVSPDLDFVVVADGIGGSEAGEIASSIFIEAAREIFGQKSQLFESETSLLIREVFLLGNERILAHAEKHPDFQGMGCTAEVIAFANDCYIAGHVGDSRTYLFRDGELRQITRDHSLVQKQVEQGLISLEEAKKHYLRNIILRAVGINSAIELDIIRGKILPGDIFLLCSDGLTDMVDDNSIQDTLSSKALLTDKVEQLIASANLAGGNDNITVALCAVSPE
jgi:protein phosphatase